MTLQMDVRTDVQNNIPFFSEKRGDNNDQLLLLCTSCSEPFKSLRLQD